MNDNYKNGSMSPLLFDTPEQARAAAEAGDPNVITIYPSIAKAFGLNTAIFLGYLHTELIQIERNKGNGTIDEKGRPWFRQSLSNIVSEPDDLRCLGLEQREFKAVRSKLIRKGILLYREDPTEGFKGGVNSFYSINYKKLRKVLNTN
ncbi:MAG TPA: hypothetical protein PKD55_11655 [Bellilinea sp.]|nr:hypothetical protein [Bellilinea sp.]